MRLPIADLHCDLLSYLAGHEGHSPLDAQVRCSIPQLQAGNVRLQALAIGYETKEGSATSGLKQIRCFQKLIEEQGDSVVAIDGPDDFQNALKGQRTGVIVSIENASSFCEEDEPLRAGLKRFQEITKTSRPLYVSLTWNMENRFGGGALTTIGLKHDGRSLLEFLDGRQVAVDLSHASDHLAHDILDHISRKKLDVAVMASHSNARSVKNVPRNLPTEFVREIFDRQGVIGVNFIKAFVGDKTEDIAQHVATLMELDGEDRVGFGADFFYGGDIPQNTPGRSVDGWFFPELQDSSCYDRVITVVRDQLGLSDDSIEKLAYRNVFSFFSRLRQAEVFVC